MHLIKYEYDVVCVCLCVFSTCVFFEMVFFEPVRLCKNNKTSAFLGLVELIYIFTQILFALPRAAVQVDRWGRKIAEARTRAATARHSATACPKVWLKLLRVRRIFWGAVLVLVMFVCVYVFISTSSFDTLKTHLSHTQTDSNTHILAANAIFRSLRRAL